MPLKFNALLYGVDLPPVGVNVAVYFVAERLFIDNMAIELHSRQLTVSVGGFDHNELFLNWRDNEGEQWALKVLSTQDIQLLVDTAPSSLQPQLTQWHQRNSHIKTVWGVVGALVVTVVFTIGLFVWKYDNIVSWVAEQIPVSTEQKLGEAALAQIKADGTLIQSGLAVEQMQAIGARLTQGSRYQYQWFIKQDNTVNAFALPGGIVVVHSALLEKAENADELAAVLAHEVQHIEQRHSLKHMINSVGWAAVLTVVLGDASAITAVLAHQVGTSYFSRDLESEADKLGYAILVKAKIKPDGMASFLQKLADLSGDSQEGVAWISSHPETKARVNAIKQLLKEQPCNTCQPLVIDWQLVKNALPKVDKAKGLE
jgi:Zn-dependent protease with chaperone function